MNLITRETLEQSRKRQSEYFLTNNRGGSQPIPMFVDGKFNTNNWNGGDDLIRSYCHHVQNWSFPSDSFEIDFENDVVDIYSDLIVTISHHEGTNYLTIIAHGHDNKAEETEWYTDLYLVQWYKSRGRTEKVLYNGRAISEDEYVLLLNLIERTGFKFVLDK